MTNVNDFHFLLVCLITGMTVCILTIVLASIVGPSSLDLAVGLSDSTHQYFTQKFRTPSGNKSVTSETWATVTLHGMVLRY